MILLVPLKRRVRLPQRTYNNSQDMIDHVNSSHFSNHDSVGSLTCVFLWVYNIILTRFHAV
jgi:hypothetical protein